MKVISAFGFHFLCVVVSFPCPHFILLLSCFYCVAKSFEIHYEDYDINNSGFLLSFGVLSIAYRIYQSDFTFLSLYLFTRSPRARPHIQRAARQVKYYLITSQTTAKGQPACLLFSPVSICMYVEDREQSSYADQYRKTQIRLDFVLL